MYLSPQEHRSNLERLRKDLSSKKSCDCIIADESAKLQVAQKMPLCHTTSEKSFPEVIKTGAFLSAKQRGAKSRSADVRLGGTDEICFYLGSAAFPGNEFGFLFSHLLTDELSTNASATPFDSGGCMGRYTLPPGSDPIDYVKIHSMPVPECRHYLGDLLSSHFVDPTDYLSGQLFTCPGCGKNLADPHGLADYPHGLVRMHEVRIPERVDLKFPHLLAVFAPQGNVPSYLAPLVASGVELVPYNNQEGANRFNALRKASVDFILQQVLN